VTDRQTDDMLLPYMRAGTWQISSSVKILICSLVEDKPSQWSRFAAVSLIMKIRRTQLPVMVYNDVFKKTYTLARKPGRLFGYDSLKTLSGCAQTKNWIGSAH